MTHVHDLTVYDRKTIAGGDGEIVWSVCDCGLQSRRRLFHGEVIEIRFRAGGVDWRDPVELLRLDLPVKICHECHGEKVIRPSQFSQLEARDCHVCGGLGVTTGTGGRIR